MKQTVHIRHGMATITLLACAMLPIAVFAGGTATIMSGGNTMQLAWQDNGTVRMDTGDEGQYMIMRDGKIYSVDTSQQPPRVIDMSGMIKMFAAMAGQSAQSTSPFGQIDSIEATGETATVAGIRGRTYRITMTQSDGSSETTDAVLTDDPLVVSMTSAYVDALLQTLAPKVADSLRAALPDDDRGLLQTGQDDFHITAISDDEPAASQFELPAKPTSLRQMMQQMKQQQTQKK